MEGIADLPLHEGHVPLWLIRLMKRMARALVEIIVEEYGPDKFVIRLSNPLWFQAFNNIIGMDWDSSGSTTVTLGILKEVLKDGQLGVMVLGGKGRKARKVPEEIVEACSKLNISSSIEKELIKASKLSAKVDSAMLQDGYMLYHHSMILSNTGLWAIVQQGMNVDIGMARRYHWLSKNMQSFVRKPHTAIAGKKNPASLNLIDEDIEKTRKTILDLARENPRKFITQYLEALRILKKQHQITSWITMSKASISMVSFKPRLIYYAPLTSAERIMKVLGKVYEAQPRTLEEMLIQRGVGPSVIRALTLVSDLIYNEPPSWNDPITHPYDPFKYTFAVGGKDGIPYPVNRRVMSEVVENLEEIVCRAKIGDKEKLRALRRLRKLIGE